MRVSSALALAAFVAGCGRPLTGPPAHPWASFPVGTWAEMSVRIGGREWTERWQLVEKSETAVRLRVEQDGKSADQTHAVLEEPWSADGGETLELAGRSFGCRREVRGGERRWMSDRVPAWPVREQNQEGETVLAAVGERAGGYECLVFETRLAGGGTARRWKSLEVPGHVVREVRRAEMGEATVEVKRWGRGAP